MSMGAYHSYFVYPLDFSSVQAVDDVWCVLRDEGTLVLIGGQGNTQSIEIDAGGCISALTFTADGECICRRWWF